MDKMTELLQKQEDLHPDLAHYRTNDGNIPRICHPLIYSLFHNDQMNAFVNEQFRLKKIALSDAIQDEKWGTYIFLHERPYRLQAFLEYSDEMKDKEYWELLADVWVDSENIWQCMEDWICAIQAERGDQQFFMDDRELKAYRRLKFPRVVYRGCNEKNRNGLSWTLTKKTAKMFATRCKGEVIEREIMPHQVFAFKQGRGEQEIILTP
jgi:hypothetical protein